MIGGSGERGSGKSVLATRHDDDVVHACELYADTGVNQRVNNLIVT